MPLFPQRLAVRAAALIGGLLLSAGALAQTYPAKPVTLLVPYPAGGVSDVIAFTPEQLRPVPQLDASLGTDHILAIGAVQDRMLFLLDIEKLMGSEEMGLMRQTAQTNQ